MDSKIKLAKEERFTRHLSLTSLYLMFAIGICGLTALLVSKWKGLMEFYIRHEILMFFATSITMIALVVYLVLATKSQNKNPKQSKYPFPLTIIAFVAFAALVGLTLAPIFLIYTESSIFSTFFVTALIFGLAALNGVTTKFDMSKWLPYLFLAIIGILVISLINYFVESKPIDYIIGILGVLIFTICTAWEVQQIKIKYKNVDDSPDELTQNKNALFDSITLFLNFKDVFLCLLLCNGRNKSSAECNPNEKIHTGEINLEKIVFSKGLNDEAQILQGAY